MPDDTTNSRPQPFYKTYDLKVALVALYYDYGKPERGTSYEHDNIYLCIKEMFREALFFDYHKVYVSEGRARMNAALLEFVKKERPDITIFPLFQDEFLAETVEELSKYTTTLCYFFDDIWRVEFANYWAPHFNYFVTNSNRALQRYRMLGAGYENAILSPFGYNHFTVRKKDLPKLYDVSFVGGSNPWRSWVVKRLRKAGIEVAAWGGGPLWPAGPLTHDGMVDVINQSKISLNLSNSVNWHLPYVLSSWRAFQVNRKSTKVYESLKGRMFEICGCGTFQLTYYVEDLERCFEIGREVAIYADLDDLIEKIRYYLRFEDEREAIAAAGHGRALREYSYATRFTEIVDQILAGRASS